LLTAIRCRHIARLIADERYAAIVLPLYFYLRCCRHAIAAIIFATPY